MEPRRRADLALQSNARMESLGAIPRIDLRATQVNESGQRP